MINMYNIRLTHDKQHQHTTPLLMYNLRSKIAFTTQKQPNDNSMELLHQDYTFVHNPPSILRHIGLYSIFNN